VYNIFGYMSLVSPWHKKTDPLLTDIRNKYGMDYLKDFGLDGEFNTTIIKNAKEKPQEFLAISKSVAALLDNFLLCGSNSWVIAPKKTKNGKVIFANDHIDFRTWEHGTKPIS
jgi:penicillin amidase